MRTANWRVSDDGRPLRPSGLEFTRLSCYLKDGCQARFESWCRIGREPKDCSALVLSASDSYRYSDEEWELIGTALLFYARLRAVADVFAETGSVDFSSDDPSPAQSRSPKGSLSAPEYPGRSAPLAEVNRTRLGEHVCNCPAASRKQQAVADQLPLFVE